MAIGFDKALGIHEQALLARSRRAEILANNLANADTPGFKARDVDFSKVMETVASHENHPDKLMTTNSRHIAFSTENSSEDSDLLYRIPSQPSLDGNTVDTYLEKSEFSKNALSFQASFTFLNSKFRGLVSAIRGE